jgi:hypothetical protein
MSNINQFQVASFVYTTLHSLASNIEPVENLKELYVDIIIYDPKILYLNFVICLVN